jgi:O-antigen/teichoic acid export membrane protein
MSFILSPFSITLSALIRRDMDFVTLARSGFASNTTTVAVSVVLALAGQGFMAPVYGAAAGSAMLLLMLMVSRPELGIFRPSLRQSGEIFRFGAVSSAVVMINLLYNASPQFILGRMLTFDAVGLYGRAISITQLFDRLVLQVLNPVVMPAIANQKRAGDDLKRIYLQSAELISAVHWPFLMFLALMARPIVSVWLGPTWAPVVPPLQLLCIASMSLFAACLTYPVLVAAGRVQDTLLSSLISLPPSILIVYVAAPHGVLAVAASSLISLPLQSVVALAFVSRALRFDLRELLVSVRKSALVAGCASGGPAMIVGIGGLQNGQVLGLLDLLLAASLSALGWVAGLVVTRHPLARHLLDPFLLIRAAWGRRRIHRPGAAEASESAT